MPLVYIGPTRFHIAHTPSSAALMATERHLFDPLAHDHLGGEGREGRGGEGRGGEGRGGEGGEKITRRRSRWKTHAEYTCVGIGGGEKKRDLNELFRSHSMMWKKMRHLDFTRHHSPLHALLLADNIQPVRQEQENEPFTLLHVW